jgi:hypothetical protein
LYEPKMQNRCHSSSLQCIWVQLASLRSEDNTRSI